MEIHLDVAGLPHYLRCCNFNIVRVNLVITRLIYVCMHVLGGENLIWTGEASKNFRVRGVNQLHNIFSQYVLKMNRRSAIFT